MGRLGAGVAAAQTGLVCGLCVAPLPRLRLLGDARQLPGIRAAFIILHTYLSVCITPLAEVSSTVMDNRNIHPVFYSLGLKPVITVLFHHLQTVAKLFKHHGMHPAAPFQYPCMETQQILNWHSNGI